MRLQRLSPLPFMGPNPGMIAAGCPLIQFRQPPASGVATTQKCPAAAMWLPSAPSITRLAVGLGTVALLPLIGASTLGPLARTLAPAAPAATAAPSGSAGATVPELPQKEAFFGETHIHTACSFDAARR